jgi:hypothetical protein
MLFDVEEFVRTLKYGTLLYHHGPIDRIFSKFVHTGDYEQFVRDLIVQTGSREVVLESAFVTASLSRGNPSVTDPCSKSMSPSRDDTPSPPDPMPRPYRTRTRSQES